MKEKINRWNFFCLTLIISGLIGSVGYINLILTSSWYLLCFLLFCMANYYNHLYLYGALIKYRHKKSSSENDLFTEYLLPVFFNFVRFVVVLISFYILFWLLGWDRNTPLIRETIALWQWPLLQTQNTTITVGSILTALLILMISLPSSRWISGASDIVLFQKVKSIDLRRILVASVRFLVLAIAVGFVVYLLNIDLAIFTVFAATLGVGIGFGMQAMVNNLISGILIIIERPVRINDLVEVRSELGFVQKIGIRSLILRRFDKREVIIPNADVISHAFVNHTLTNDLIRNEFFIGIEYDSNTELAVECVLHVASQCEFVQKDPPPCCFVWELADSAVILRFHYHMLKFSSDSDITRNILVSGIKQAFHKAGIQIASPRQAIDIHSVNGLPKPAENQPNWLLQQSIDASSNTPSGEKNA